MTQKWPKLLNLARCHKDGHEHAAASSAALETHAYILQSVDTTWGQYHENVKGYVLLVM